MLVLFIISIVIALMFMISPVLLKCEQFFDFAKFFFEELVLVEYKSAFIGAIGGMIGSFLAITGALWVAKKTAKDENQKEIQKNALIVYYDIKLFFE